MNIRGALGGGETLGEGVYSISGSSVLSDTLNLDGGNNSNALFIFQISGTFAATDLSTVVLKNGAMACNVFWKIEGVVSLLSGSKVEGSIINQAAINMSPGVILEGRALSTSGAINVNQVLAYTPVGCGSAVLTGPVAPALRTTANFGLFSSIGNVSNGGVSHITGDVGSNTAAPTGFNASDVSGVIHPGPDLETQGADNDLLMVYDTLQSLTPDIELLFPPDFGFNLKLTPHTYLLNSATVLTDTVYLDAQGNSNAVFVIKISGAFSTGTGAKVILMNGAQAKNVYWKVTGAVTVAANSLIAGTFVVAGAIDLQTNVILAGRALTKNGALSTAAVTTTMMADGTLPVTWISFTGKPAGDNVLLEWTTANELNNGSFTIYKSRDGRGFTNLTTVNAQAEIKNTQYYYSFTDKLPYTNGFYRISQTDKDGVKSYYKTIQVKLNVNRAFKAINYVQQNYVYVQASGAAPANGLITIYSITGELIASQKILLTKEESTYKIIKPLSKGIYLLGIESNGEKLYNKKVVIF